MMAMMVMMMMMMMMSPHRITWSRAHHRSSSTEMPRRIHRSSTFLGSVERIVWHRTIRSEVRVDRGSRRGLLAASRAARVCAAAKWRDRVSRNKHPLDPLDRAGVLNDKL
jgi:hypothetical protein